MKYLSDTEVLSLYDRYVAGELTTALAKEAGVTVATLYNRWRNRGLTLKTRPDWRLLDHKRIIDLFKAGLTYEECCRAFKITTVELGMILAKRND